MQPLAMFALASGIVMVIGVSVTLVLTLRNAKPHPVGINRWQRHGSVPLGAAALALGAISRDSGQSPTSHRVIVATACALFLGALVCAVAGGVAGKRHQRTTR